MADVVNLRIERKRARRKQDEARAQENRAAFGTARAIRDRLSAEADLARRQLDQHQLERPHSGEREDT